MCIPVASSCEVETCLTRGVGHKITQIETSFLPHSFPPGLVDHHLSSLTHSFASDLLAMVANNPLFSGRWTAKKFQATVINDIWPETTFFTLIALSTRSRFLYRSFRLSINPTVVTLVSKLTPHKLQFSNALLTVLGTVLGLVISFRTSSAYER